MKNSQKIKVIIPAFNEENSIAKVLNDIPNTVDEVIVVNNNSTVLNKVPLSSVDMSNKVVPI